ncbi:MAG TPA: lasso peptide biosynthesis B2 protein [Thermoanaerobaculaceae bacterium]|nr:lasso peptide biosynthesis B2 protein [Thermoanaerobaculaceae bacterium]
MPAANESAGETRFSVREIALFLHALRLSVKAQRVQRRSLEDVAGALVRTRPLPRGVGADAAARAAGRACSRVKRWAGGLDTCLTRSLVAGALLADRPGVVLHVGFRGQATGPLHEGHAWVTLDGRNVTDARDGEHAGPFTEALRVPLRRGGESRP